MAITIVLTNQKGGVGKTTTTGALAAGLVEKGKRVLALDMDPQGNLGFSLGLEASQEGNLYDLMKGRKKIQDVIHHTKYCDIVLADIALSAGVMEFNGIGREVLIKRALDSVQDEYDFIVIDTPPALNILTVNAYVVSDYLIVPMTSEILSLVGLTQIKDTVSAVRDTLNPKIGILGILLTKYNGRVRLSKEVEEMATTIADQLGTSLFEAKIRSSVSVSELPAHGMSIYEYAPQTKPAQDYRDFVEEVLQRIG